VTSDRTNTAVGTSTRAPGRPARAGSSAAPHSPQQFSRFTDAEIAEANAKLAEAFSIVGCLGEPLTCPECGTNEKKKVNFKTSRSSGQPYWKCFKCGANGSATKLLTDKAGLTFVEAMNQLLGRDTRRVDVKPLPTVVIEPPFQAVVDVEVYDFIRDAGSVEAAQRYWATWHLAPDVVADSGSTMLTDPAVVSVLLTAAHNSAEYKAAWGRHVAAVRKVHDELRQRFGMERLYVAGVAMEVDGKTGPREYFLVNEDYPVIEVHESPNGRVVGMQFRPIGRTKARIDAHKAWKRRWEAEARRRWPDDESKRASDAWEAVRADNPDAAGDKHEYVTSQLSIRGAGTDSLVGCGLRRIAQLPAGSMVVHVEGFKDLLAIRTLGSEGYGIPGTGNMPPEKACRVLERHDNVVAMDGDAAGEKGRNNLIAHYAATRRVVVGVQVAADTAPRLAEALGASEELTRLFDTPAVNHRADGNVWIAGRPAPGANPAEIIALVAKISRVPVERVAREQRGVRARPMNGVRAGMDVTDVLVERVAHTGCGCPTCRTWRTEHPADPATCTCAVCAARRDGHQFDPACTCPACRAGRARQVTEPLLR
jgi:hypothetical protein